jgi:hypothetical protein
MISIEQKSLIKKLRIHSHRQNQTSKILTSRKDLPKLSSNKNPQLKIKHHPLWQNQTSKILSSSKDSPK